MSHRTTNGCRLARKFLYVVAGVIVLAIASAFAYRIFGTEIMRWWAVPKAPFTALPPVAENAYADKAMWVAHPAFRDDPARWTPPGVDRATDARPAAVFFVHPTSFLGNARWNATLDDQETNDRAALFTRGQASAFNGIGRIWAPRYRQATFGAFMTGQSAANQALDLAYRDVAAAFDQFLKEAGDAPIILAAHSQGSRHLTWLLRDRVAGTPLARRIVAVYAIGWPISRTADLPALGLPECQRPDQSGCILSWESFAEPADPALVLDTYDASTGFTGASRRGTPILCTNPLTGTPDADAPASANLGTLVPSADFTTAQLVPASVPARCNDRGLLMIGDPPQLGNYVLPGNNYHVYDYNLFWSNVRADAARRLAAFLAR